jgi:hypothetical protein
MFLHRLALALGRTKRELLRSISHAELMEWVEYCRVEPFGDWRADVRNAQLASVIANVNRDRKKRSEPYSIKDFMLKFESAGGQKKQGGAEGVISPATVAWLFASAATGKTNVH